MDIYPFDRCLICYWYCLLRYCVDYWAIRLVYTFRYNHRITILATKGNQRS